VLERLPLHANLLDVGIGTGAPLATLADVIRTKKIRVHGIDIDETYLARCIEVMRAASLLDVVTCEHRSIVDYTPTAMFDAVYFSNSFMIIPPQHRLTALRNAQAALAPDGQRTIYFTQTHEKVRSRIAEILKPLFKYLVTIDFGRITYEDEFFATLTAAGLHVTEVKDVFSYSRRSIKLIVAKQQ
jgi:ubiquinone/menaquinone biosynthesis C-methylase UbiE